MYVLTNSEYIPVYCSKNAITLLEKAMELISKEKNIPNVSSDFVYQWDSGEIDFWDEVGWNEYYQETQMGWVLTYWKITKVEEI